MTVLPPSFFEDTDDFQDDDADRDLDEEELEDHQHGNDCGHEAVQHGDHVDYVTEKHHWLLKDGSGTATRSRTPDAR